MRAHRPVARVVCLSSGGVCARTGRLSPSRARGSGRGRVGADCGALGGLAISDRTLAYAQRAACAAALDTGARCTTAVSPRSLLSSIWATRIALETPLLKTAANPPLIDRSLRVCSRRSRYWTRTRRRRPPQSRRRPRARQPPANRRSRFEREYLGSPSVACLGPNRREAAVRRRVFRPAPRTCCSGGRSPAPAARHGSPPRARPRSPPRSVARPRHRAKRRADRTARDPRAGPASRGEGERRLPATEALPLLPRFPDLPSPGFRPFPAISSPTARMPSTRRAIITPDLVPVRLN